MSNHNGNGNGKKNGNGNGYKSLYDRIYDKYDLVMNASGYTFASKKIVEALPNNFKNPNILDLGCGTGITTDCIEKRFSGASIIGLDGSEKMLDLYLKKHPEKKAVLGDFNQEEFFYSYPNKMTESLDPGSFDIIISVGAVLEYGVLENVFSFTHKLLKENGMLVIVGAKKNIFNCISGKLCWKYEPVKTDHIISVMQEFNFKPFNDFHVSFPVNLFKEVIVAYK